MDDDPDRVPYESFKELLIGEITKHKGWDFIIPHLEEHDVIRTLYKTYRPNVNGWWHGAPLKWTSMFSWMSCPIYSVRAIVLLMEPKLPTPAVPPARPSAFYISNGYALGVVRANLKLNGQVVDDADPVDITNIPTVWNFVDILCQVFSLDDEHRDMLKFRFQDGFNPEILSAEGVLFMNVYWTKRRFVARKIDQELWWPITKKVLEKIDELDDNVVVFQLYNKEIVSEYLDGIFKNRVIRPPFMRARGDSNEGLANHLGRFENHHIAIYADEIKKKAFELLLMDIKKDGNDKAFRNLRKVLSLFYTLVS